MRCSCGWKMISVGKNKYKCLTCSDERVIMTQEEYMRNFIEDEVKTSLSSNYKDYLRVYYDMYRKETLLRLDIAQGFARVNLRLTNSIKDQAEVLIIDALMSYKKDQL